MTAIFGVDPGPRILPSLFLFAPISTYGLIADRISEYLSPKRETLLRFKSLAVLVFRFSCDLDLELFVASGNKT